jgi:hypothetical protein
MILYLGRDPARLGTTKRRTQYVAYSSKPIPHLHLNGNTSLYLAEHFVSLILGFLMH